MKKKTSDKDIANYNELICPFVNKNQFFQSCQDLILTASSTSHEKNQNESTFVQIIDENQLYYLTSPQFWEKSSYIQNKNNLNKSSNQYPLSLKLQNTRNFVFNEKQIQIKSLQNYQNLEQNIFQQDSLRFYQNERFQQQSINQNQEQFQQESQDYFQSISLQNINIQENLSNQSNEFGNNSNSQSDLNDQNDQISDQQKDRIFEQKNLKDFKITGPSKNRNSDKALVCTFKKRFKRCTRYLYSHYIDFYKKGRVDFQQKLQQLMKWLSTTQKYRLQHLIKMFGQSIQQNEIQKEFKKLNRRVMRMMIREYSGIQIMQNKKMINKINNSNTIKIYALRCMSSDLVNRLQYRN